MSLVYDQEAEGCVLGTLFGPYTTKRHIATCLELLTEADFSPPNAVVFATIREAFVSGIDLTHPLALKHELRRKGHADLEENLFELLHFAPDNNTARQHVSIVKYAARLREWQRLSAPNLHTAEDIQKAATDAYELLERIRSGEVTLPEPFEAKLLDSHIQSLETPATGTLFTGLEKLDSKLGGLHRGSFVVVGGRTSIGKTAFCTQLALSAAHSDLRTMFVSLEMSKREMINRFLAQEADVSNHALHTRRLNDEQMLRLSSVGAPGLQELPLILDVGSPRYTPSRLANRLKTAIGAYGKVDVLVVDYLQLIRGDRKHDTQASELGEVSQSLKALASEHDMIVVAAAQLNRQMEHGDEVRLPRLSDLRGSGTLEQDADVVLLLHRQKQEVGLSATYEQQILIAKNRHGKLDYVDVLFHGVPNRFEAA